LSLSPKEEILVFDVGGGHVASAIFDPAERTLRNIAELPTPASNGGGDFFHTLESLTRRMPPLAGPLAGISLAMPNPFDYEHGVSYMKHKYQQLYGVDLRQGIAERLRCSTQRIHFLNDAAAFLGGELCRGTAGGVNSVVGITLGTGIGSAFATGGEIVMHGHGIPEGGEIWNLSYDGGIVEDFVSTLAIQKLYEKATGTVKEVREIATFAETQPEARQVFADFGKSLGQVLRFTCQEFRPRRIVLGGGISRSAALFLPFAEAELNDPEIDLRVSRLDHATLIGAGVSWTRKYMPEINGERILEES
jgi:glucokinase